MRKLNSVNWFYAYVLTFNLMVLGMFYVISRPLPSVMAESVSATTEQLQVEKKAQSAVVAQPVNIMISSVGIDLQVIEGSYDRQQKEWVTSDTAALHADSSMPINDVNGVTLVYAHALSNLFGNLVYLKPGDVAEVAGDTGQVFRYKYMSNKQVPPSDTSVFNSSGPPTLVLQTCSGPWDTYRTLYYFEFINVSEK